MKAGWIAALGIGLLVGGGVTAGWIYAFGDDGASPNGSQSRAGTGGQQAATGRRGRRAGSRGRRRGGAAIVTVAKVAFRTIGNRVAAVGTGRAFRSLTLTADVSGVVKAIRFRPGMTVKEEQPLVVLESEAEEIAVKLARVKAADAQATVARYEKLRGAAAATVVQLEQARTALAVAKADLEAKLYALRRRTIRAPFAGVMGLTSLSRGDYVKESVQIATIDDRTRLVVEFVVSERAASLIKLGLPVRALTPAIVGVVFDGTVSAVDSRIDATSRTLKVEATLPNTGNRLIPGMTFSVNIRVQGDRLPTVPGLAVKWDRRGAHVWKVGADRKVARIGVTIRRRENDQVSVRGNLKEGDQVVTSGFQRLRPGATVSIAANE
jgi:RND family efflux transporter MFP subunit